jgi:trans-aconitate 2-methyltransferase
VDVVFSNAVFHWVPDHDALFARLHAALGPGGRLVAQCGGAGNVERFHAVAREVGDAEPFAEYLAGWGGPWNMAGREETERRLLEAGFDDVRVWLEPHPVVPDYTLEYLRTVCLGHHVERLPEDLRDDYVAAVAERCGHPLELDYVRLNMDAHV